MKGKDLIGKQAKGFKFLENPQIGWNRSMFNHVGEVGEITNYEGSGNKATYAVRFKSDSYWYPAIGIEEQFIEEPPEKELSIEELINQMKNLTSQI
jgi:disulfide oxidoreductase YuzD